MTKTPLGIMILGIINILVGLLLVFGSLLLLGIIAMIFPPWLTAITGAILIIGIFYLLLGWGLITLQSWAWWVDFIFAIINLILSVASYPSISWTMFIINLIIVIYLNQGSIKRAFKV